MNFFIHTPVCCPSRSELVTGRYLHNVKLPVDERQCGDGYAGNDAHGNVCCMHVDEALVNNRTLALYLQREAGYTVGMFGKCTRKTSLFFVFWLVLISLLVLAWPAGLFGKILSWVCAHRPEQLPAAAAARLRRLVRQRRLHLLRTLIRRQEHREPPNDPSIKAKWPSNKRQKRRSFSDQL